MPNWNGPISKNVCRHPPGYTKRLDEQCQVTGRLVGSNRLSVCSKGARRWNECQRQVNTYVARYGILGARYVSLPGKRKPMLE